MFGQTGIAGGREAVVRPTARLTLRAVSRMGIAQIGRSAATRCNKIRFPRSSAGWMPICWIAKIPPTWPGPRWCLRTQLIGIVLDNCLVPVSSRDIAAPDPACPCDRRLYRIDAQDEMAALTL